MIAERVLPLSGIHNFRDYGGYAVEGNGRLRDNFLWRSAHHESASDDDLAAVDALGLETVIDLRGDDERRAVGHTRIGIDHPLARRLGVDRASCGLQMRRKASRNATGKENTGREIF